MIAVYNNQNPINRKKVTDGWSSSPPWSQMLSQHRNIIEIYDLQQYLAAQSPIKLALYEIDWANGPDTHVRAMKDLASASDWLFVIEPEPHSNYVINVELHNVTWLTAGVIRRLENCSRGWQYHLWRIAELYREIPGPLEKLRPRDVKSKAFDALLGLQRPNRRFIWDQVHARALQKHISITMHGVSSAGLDTYEIDHDLVLIGEKKNYVSDAQALYHGRPVKLPCLLPIDVYNQTAYSIVAETDYDNDALIVTEKLAKPIMARRLFVVFSGVGFLEYIRSQGFLTFGNIIDESYDFIKDNQARWTAAMDQVEKLCRQDQKSVLENIKRITDHNYDLVMGHQLTSSVLDILIDKVDQLTRDKRTT